MRLVAHRCTDLLPSRAQRVHLFACSFRAWRELSNASTFELRSPSLSTTCMALLLGLDASCTAWAAVRIETSRRVMNIGHLACMAKHFTTSGAFLFIGCAAGLLARFCLFGRAFSQRSPGAESLRRLDSFHICWSVGQANGTVSSVLCDLSLKSFNFPLLAMNRIVSSHQLVAQMVQFGAMHCVHDFLPTGPVYCTNASWVLSRWRKGHSRRVREKHYATDRCRAALAGNERNNFESASPWPSKEQLRNCGKPEILSDRVSPSDLDGLRGRREARENSSALELRKLAVREFQMHGCWSVVLHGGSDLLPFLCGDAGADQHLHHALGIVEPSGAADPLVRCGVIKDAVVAAHHGLNGQIDAVHGGLSLGKDKANTQPASCGRKLHHKGLRK
jgi:hypothetical protein